MKQLSGKELAASREILDAVQIMAKNGDTESMLVWQKKALDPKANISAIKFRAMMKNETAFRFRNALNLLK